MSSGKYANLSEEIAMIMQAVNAEIETGQNNVSFSEDIKPFEKGARFEYGDLLREIACIMRDIESELDDRGDGYFEYGDNDDEDQHDEEFVPWGRTKQLMIGGLLVASIFLIAFVGVGLASQISRIRDLDRQIAAHGQEHDMENWSEDWESRQWDSQDEHIGYVELGLEDGRRAFIPVPSMEYARELVAIIQDGYVHVVENSLFVFNQQGGLVRRYDNVRVTEREHNTTSPEFNSEDLQKV